MYVHRTTYAVVCQPALPHPNSFRIDKNNGALHFKTIVFMFPCGSMRRPRLKSTLFTPIAVRLTIDERRLIKRCITPFTYCSNTVGVQSVGVHTFYCLLGYDVHPAGAVDLRFHNCVLSGIVVYDGSNFRGKLSEPFPSVISTLRGPHIVPNLPSPPVNGPFPPTVSSCRSLKCTHLTVMSP
jgi:hypothetical protein